MGIKITLFLRLQTTLTYLMWEGMGANTSLFPLFAYLFSTTFCVKKKRLSVPPLPTGLKGK